MNKGKTNYTLNFNGDAAAVDSIVKAWLMNNKFNLENKYNETFYYFNDPVLYGKRGFQYRIEGQTIIIDAWTISLGGKFIMLDSGALNNMAGDAYKGVLQGLFNQIGAASSAAPTADEGQAAPSQAAQYAQQFAEENNSRNETLAIVGFVISLIGLILPFIGVHFGIIVYIIDFYLAAQGMKSKKKGFAIATIVLSCVSIFLLIVMLALTILFA